MRINDDVRVLIVENVKKYYRYDKDFTKLSDIKFPDNGWQKFKNGETDIQKMGAGRVNAMLDALFTDFEQTLIGKAQTRYYMDNALKLKMSFSTYFDIFKKEVLIHWVENKYEDMSVGTDRIMTAGGNWNTGFLEISLKSMDFDGSENVCQLRFGKTNCPSGQENARAWVKENLNKI